MYVSSVYVMTENNLLLVLCMNVEVVEQKDQKMLILKSFLLQ